MTKNINRQFQELCIKENLQEIKQFYFDNPTIDISANNDEAFRWSCYYGQLKVSKWLLKVKPDINISAYDVFIIACENGQLKLSKLFLQHKTQNYYIFAKKDIIQIKKKYNKKQQIAKQI
jgi:hypothetical protein